MISCNSCGNGNLTEDSQFCPNCGIQKPTSFEGFDLIHNIDKYKSILSDITYLRSDKDIQEISDVSRKSLKISWKKHKLIFDYLIDQKIILKKRFDFTLEFDNNLIDSHAGHDSCLRFRFTNKSLNEFYKFDIGWFDEESKGKLESQHKKIIIPGEIVILRAILVFEKIGVKEISNLKIRVSNLLSEEEVFEVLPFTFTIKNADQLSFQQMNTTINGRVVDASNLALTTDINAIKNINPSWSELIINHALIFQEVEPLIEEKISPHVKPFKSVEENNTDSVLSPKLSWLWYAAENGENEAQYVLGEMYLKGNGLNKNLDEAIKWLTKAANSKNPSAQFSLGSIYLNGDYLIKDNSKAFYWMTLSANNNHIDAQYWLGKMYLEGIGTSVQKETAFTLFEKSAQAGSPLAIDFIDGEIKRLSDSIKNENKGNHSSTQSKSDQINERVKNLQPVDLKYSIQLTFEEGIYGTKKTMDFPSFIKCQTCNGQYVDPQSQDMPCKNCLGTGNIKSTKKLEITFPATKTSDETIIRLAKQSENEIYGAPLGDIFITTKYVDTTYFKRNGLDLYQILKIPQTIAIKGGEFKLQDLNNGYRPIVFNIPQSTVSGDVVILKGLGHGYKGEEKFNPQNGDLYIQFEIDTRAEDAEFSVELTLEESINGTKKTMTFPSFMKCSSCNGKVVGHKLQDLTCLKCGGTGSIKSTKELEITFPAVQTDDGAKIRLANQNDNAIYGMPPGDIYIIPKLVSHPDFLRIGLDLHANLKISASSAINGGELKSKTLDGTVAFDIPKNTTTGQEFRLKGKGILNNQNGKIGDLYIKIEIEPNLKINLFHRFSNINEFITKHSPIFIIFCVFFTLSSLVFYIFKN